MPQEQEAFQKLQRAKPECDHYDWQQMVPQFGQHLICIRKNLDSIETLYVSILKDSLLRNEKIHSLSTRNFGKVLDLEDFYKFVYRILGSRERQITFWRIFDSVGRQLNTIEELLRTKSFIVYTGGTFMWPGVRKGFRRRTPDGYMMETLSLQPLVFRVENFLTDEECEYVKAESEGVLRFHVAKEEGTYDGLEGVDQPEITWRTSTQAFLPSHDKPKLGVIDDRLASLTKTSVLLQEDAQVMKFEENQFYDFHHDYFDPKYFENDRGFLIQLKNNRNRLATVLWYLSTVKTGDGGHTIFPLTEGKLKGPLNIKECEPSNSLKIQPRRKDIVLYYNLHADRSMDKFSLHGACPVKARQPKWTANKWIWTDDPDWSQTRRR